jgi:hypothetical protein
MRVGIVVVLPVYTDRPPPHVEEITKWVGWDHGEEYSVECPSCGNLYDLEDFWP